MFATENTSSLCPSLGCFDKRIVYFEMTHLRGVSHRGVPGMLIPSTAAVFVSQCSHQAEDNSEQRKRKRGGELTQRP